jgi:hypothetical protein
MLDYASKYHNNSGDEDETDVNSDNLEDSDLVLKQDKSSEVLSVDESTKVTEEDQAQCVEDEKQRIEKYKDMLQRLEELEDKLGRAIEVEEYEEAAELDDAIQVLKSEMEKMNINNSDLAIDVQTDDDKLDSNLCTDNQSEDNSLEKSVLAGMDESELKDKVEVDDNVETKSEEIVVEDESEPIESSESKNRTEDTSQESSKDGLTDVDLNDNLDL